MDNNFIMCNYYNCFKSINDVESIKFMVTDARKRANNKWDKNNKERLLYLNKRSTAKNFILKLATEEDLKSIEKYVIERKKLLKSCLQYTSIGIFIRR